MSYRSAEQRHHPVAAELVDRTPESMDLGVDQFEAAPNNLTNVLRIQVLGHAGESCNITEQRGYLAALTLHRGDFCSDFLSEMVWRLKGLGGGGYLRYLYCRRLA
jgi:hypothetical protein